MPFDFFSLSIYFNASLITAISHLQLCFLQDGVTKRRAEEDEPLTPAQKQLMDSQDIRYVTYKRNIETKVSGKLFQNSD